MAEIVALDEPKPGTGLECADDLTRLGVAQVAIDAVMLSDNDKPDQDGQVAGIISLEDAKERSLANKTEPGSTLTGESIERPQIEVTLIASREGLKGYELIDDIIPGSDVEKIKKINSLANKLKVELKWSSEYPTNEQDRTIVLLIQARNAFPGYSKSSLWEPVLRKINTVLDLYMAKNMPIIIKATTGAAKKFTQFTLGPEDHISAGTVGFLRGLHNYDFHKTNSVLTYCMKRVVGSAKDQCREKGHAIRVAKSCLAIACKYRKLTEEAEHYNKSPEQISAMMDVPLPEIKAALFLLNRASVLHSWGVDSSGLPEFDEAGRLMTHAPFETMLLDELESVDLCNLFKIAYLTAREQDLMRQYYGLDPYDRPHELKEIASGYGLTDGMISKILTKSRQKIKDTAPDWVREYVK